jgi:hypothetical protein
MLYDAMSKEEATGAGAGRFRTGQTVGCASKSECKMSQWELSTRRDSRLQSIAGKRTVPFLRTRCLHSVHTSVISPHFIWCWKSDTYGILSSQYSQGTNLCLQVSSLCLAKRYASTCARVIVRLVRHAQRVQLHVQHTSSSHWSHLTRACAVWMCSCLCAVGTTAPHLSQRQFILAHRASCMAKLCADTAFIQLPQIL